MSRIIILLVPIFLIPATALEAQPQPVRPHEEPPLGSADVGPLDAKELAKAKFEAFRADPRDLARARLDAMRISNEARTREFLAGRGTLDILLESAVRVLEAGLALGGGEADPVALCELRWEQTRAFDLINTARYEAGKINIQDQMEARWAHLGAGLALLQARAKRAKPGTVALPRRPDLLPDDDSSDGSKELAKAKFEAVHADARDLAWAGLKAARTSYEAQTREYLAGRCTLDTRLKSVARLFEAELVFAASEADQVALCERHWELARESDRINTARYEAGKIPIQDSMDARCAYLEAQLALLQARARQAKPGTAAPIRPADLVPEGDASNEAKELAKDEFEAVHANPRELALARLEAARASCEARTQEFLAGRGTLDILFESSMQRLRAELDVAPHRADELTALERHWKQSKLIEDVNRGRFEDGKIAIQDYMESVWFRLGQLKLAQARSRLPG
jgi:hypothetical protein